MNKQQACKLSTFITKNFGGNLKIYDDIQFWDVDNKSSDCNFYIGVIRYTDNMIELGVSMKHCYNKVKDCPIICRFPQSKNEWRNLKLAMFKLEEDCTPHYVYVSNHFKMKRLKR